MIAHKKSRYLLLSFALISQVTHAVVHDSLGVRVVDFATEFKNAVCGQPAQEFSEAWLKFEKAHWDLYSAAYYNTEEKQSYRLKQSEKMKGRRDEVCANLIRFLERAPKVIAEVAPRIESSLDQKISIDTYFAPAIQRTDGKGASIKNRPVLILNAGHDSFATERGLMILVTHELIHAAQVLKYPEPKVSKLAKGIYSEGGAVFAVTQLMPQVSEVEAVGVSVDEFRAEREFQKTGARELLKYWDDPNPPARIFENYFSGMPKDQEYPRKMAYFLGLAIYRKIAESSSLDQALRMTPEQFSREAKNVLREIAR